MRAAYVAVGMIVQKRPPALRRWQLAAAHISDHAVDHGVSTSDEWFLDQSNAGVVKNPHVVMLIWGDDVNCVHWKSHSHLTDFLY
jgi:hypothetical protein